jgi:hypothetical protein
VPLNPWLSPENGRRLSRNFSETGAFGLASSGEITDVTARSEQPNMPFASWVNSSCRVYCVGGEPRPLIGQQSCPVTRHESCEAGNMTLSIEGISGILHKFNAKLVCMA